MDMPEIGNSPRPFDAAVAAMSLDAKDLLTQLIMTHDP